MSTSRHTALAIEDDTAILRLLEVAMSDSPFKLLTARSAKDGIELAARRSPDILLLDLGLPDAGGLKVIETVRQWSRIPIIVVSGQGQESLKVQALEAGADDYVTKPFGVSELIARMKVALRHSLALQSGSETSVFEAGALRVDFASRRVEVRGEQIHLTPIEYKLLGTLVKYAGKVVTHRQLLNEVWGPEYTEEAQYLRIYMGYLRKKLEEDPSRPTMLLTEPRVGYRLAV